MPATLRSALTREQYPVSRTARAVSIEVSPPSAALDQHSEYWRVLEQFAESREQLKKVRSLHANWDSYGAEPPSARAIELTEAVLNGLRDRFVAPSRIVASVEGGVGVCFSRGNRYADLECFNNGEIVGVVYAGLGHPRVIEATAEPAALTAAIEDIVAFINA